MDKIRVFSALFINVLCTQKKIEINARYRLSDRCGKGHTCRAVLTYRNEWSPLSLHTL